LVEAIRNNLGKGVYGAKITGGGSGGTVVVIADGDQGYETCLTIMKQYSQMQEKELGIIE
jgi:galactokinase